MYTISILRVVFVCFILLVTTQNPPTGSCPNSCSGHGSCYQDVCTCELEWKGIDCSVELRVLQPGVTVYAEVNAWSWNYYVIVNDVPGGSIKVEISPQDPADTTSDCDVFVRKNDLPTSISWDAENIDWGTQAIVIIQNAVATRWYIGVNANYFLCRYSITASLTGNCPYGCVHGTCQNDGSCICDNGWAGPECDTSIPTTPLALDRTIVGSVNVGLWKYYFVNLTKDYTELDISINITNTPLIFHDCDIYVKYNEIPSLLNWDYQDISFDSPILLSIPHATAGRWYIGVWGYRQCDFTLNVSVVTKQCISLCSHHGSCTPPCRCQPDYEGDYCQNKTTPLLPEVTVTGYVEQNIWNYYRFVTDGSQSNVIISVSQTGTSGDCDLYIKLDDTPTRWNYDYLEISSATNFQKVIDDVVRRTINIGVFGWLTTEYRLNVTTSQSCVYGCVHGTCQSGICECQMGWSGPACDAQHVILSSGQMVNGTLQYTNDWLFYRYNSTTTTVVVSLKEEEPTSDSVGLLYLLVAEGQQPTLRRYDYMDTDLNKGFHTITITLDTRSGQTIDWYIGVYASVFVINPISFRLVVWEPPN